MWTKLDDGFHSHPKVRSAGNAAAGLFARLLSYAGQHLTDGVVLGAVARDYGTAPQLRKLVSVGLLHEQGHTCARCPQPEAGDYVLHDYLVPNPTRTQVREGRSKDAQRKQHQRNRDANRPRNASDSPTNATRNETQPAPESDLGFQAEPQVTGDRHGGRLTGARVDQTRPDPSTPYGGTNKQAPRASSAPRIAEPVRPLVDAMTAAGLVVGWELSADEWLLLHALIDRCTVPVLVDHARGMWDNARSRPQSGRYFLPGWRALPSLPASAPTGPAMAAGNVVPMRRPAAGHSDTLLAGLALLEREQAQ
ncbi:mucin-2 [Streptomyces sp. NA04227]|uniref:mucin-2 n=1 Tax=Streptomyces sp. NA04227 TaxID=2742136 RepID=UPI0015928447|nr:mucin-2 [Streptomyces sp. NA04227]QKW08064.1 mucin-2 [Streptomyces sp. NA04227]